MDIGPADLQACSGAYAGGGDNEAEYDEDSPLEVSGVVRHLHQEMICNRHWTGMDHRTSGARRQSVVVTFWETKKLQELGVGILTNEEEVLKARSDITAHVQPAYEADEEAGPPLGPDECDVGINPPGPTPALTRLDDGLGGGRGSDIE